MKRKLVQKCRRESCAGERKIEQKETKVWEKRRDSVKREGGRKEGSSQNWWRNAWKEK